MKVVINSYELAEAVNKTAKAVATKDINGKILEGIKAIAKNDTLTLMVQNVCMFWHDLYDTMISSKSWLICIPSKTLKGKPHASAVWGFFLQKIRKEKDNAYGRQGK